jgi:hypothetical protein
MTKPAFGSPPGPIRTPVASLAVIALFQIALPFELLTLRDEQLSALSYQVTPCAKGYRRVTDHRGTA